MVATDADKDDCFVHHSVGVDSNVGLYVIDGQGRELGFSQEVQERLYEALSDKFAEERERRLVDLSTPDN
jgi:5-carboxymethyl-2-hydroxymuconate isomerase